MLAGLGAGVALGAIATVIAEGGDRSRTGVTTALYNNVKTLGGAVAGGVMVSLPAASASRGHGDGSPAKSGYVAVWLLCAVPATARRR
ncbi:hypothetical protein OG866_39505 [Streptomyces sp. NBC_00663]|uniref:hypothetical protein n=1 Tax=Streptomyces sp. NBC_00663 TaxID=2975801 RepID=UPI002E35702A|nr:hypothetical protein [Streptomyces sp. NBC_00663]